MLADTDTGGDRRASEMTSHKFRYNSAVTVEPISGLPFVDKGNSIVESVTGAFFIGVRSVMVVYKTNTGNISKKDEMTEWLKSKKVKNMRLCLKK